MALNCDLAGQCAGCPWIQEKLLDQHAKKLNMFQQLWREKDLNPDLVADLGIESLGEGGIRDRADLTLFREEDGMRLGLYDRHHKHILHMTNCPMMTPPLSQWHQLFKQHIPDLRLGGIRLRVAPNGQRGLWLDFPNTERDRFLREQTWLRAMNDLAIVEIGQKRQRLIVEEGQLQLGDIHLYPWFETYLEEKEHPLPLYCSVGSFTQTGFAANRILIRRVMEKARKFATHRWLELGCGIGNFTLPLAAEGFKVTAIENDPRAIAGLERSARESGLQNNITIKAANIHRQDSHFLADLEEAEALLVDPPRSGLRAFLDVLAEAPAAKTPHHILYVSCFAQSLIEDSAKLLDMGYRIESAQGLDQFPQSNHCEWILSFKR